MYLRFKLILGKRLLLRDNEDGVQVQAEDISGAAT